MKSVKPDLFDAFYFVGTALLAAGAYFIQPHYPFFVVGAAFVYVAFARGRA